MPNPEESEKLSDAPEPKAPILSESIISDTTNQNSWLKIDQVIQANAPHPSEVNGIKAIESFGINFDDGSVLTARNNREVNLPKPIFVSKTAVGDYAQELGEGQRRRWANEGPDKKIRKCNLYADCVFRDLKIPLPWEEGETPLVKNMYSKLMKATSDWELVSSGERAFANYVPQPGDLVIWDKTVSSTINGRRISDRLHHCGVMGNSGLIHYAGSGVEGGYTDSIFKLMVDSAAYGKPTFIFRSKHVH
jgi:hypothetical protein